MGILHVMDLGVTAYVLGNVLWQALDKSGLAHTRKEGRCELLWEKLQAYYKANSIKYQLQNLTLTMIKAKGTPPKVRGTGMQVRYLVDFGGQVACEMYQLNQSSHFHMVHLLMLTLQQLYQCMLGAWDPHHACHLSIGFAHLFYTLAAAHEGNPSKVWYVKPKFHFMEELFQKPSV